MIFETTGVPDVGLCRTPALSTAPTKDKDKDTNYVSYFGLSLKFKTGLREIYSDLHCRQ